MRSLADIWWFRKAGRRGWIIGLIAIPAVLFGSCPTWTARVVNVIPSTLPTEANQNAEPTLAVDPTNADRMVASAMLLHNVAPGSGGNECPALRSGLVVSTDRGNTWTMQCVLELDNAPGADFAGDPSLDFVGSGNTLVAAYLTPAFSIPSSGRVVEGTLIGPIVAITNTRLFNTTDQPHIAGDRDAAGMDYTRSTSAIEQTCAQSGSIRDAVVHFKSPNWPTPTCFLERPAQMEIPAVRSAWHASGTVYTAFYLPTKWTGGTPDDGIAVVRADIVVTKGTRGTNGVVTYGVLAEGPPPSPAGLPNCTSPDGRSGIRMARCLTIPQNNNIDATFGQERRALSQLSIAVHPTDADIVYVAWGDSTPGSKLTLHVRASFDGGTTWDTNDRITVPNATNPVLAVNKNGAVGFAYQQLVVRGSQSWWDTVFILASPDFWSTGTFRLAEAKANAPPALYVPYLGDYMDLTAVGEEFYGIFSASNDFATSVFPHGVTYARTAPGPGGVQVSIDPYFFAIERRPTWISLLHRLSKALSRREAR